MALSSSTEDIHGLIAAVNSAAAKLTGNIESHADQRKALLSAAQRLTVSLETPSETAWRILWQVFAPIFISPRSSHCVMKSADIFL